MQSKSHNRSLQIVGMAWLVALYFGLTYLAVGAISVSQINSRFGDQAGYIFHLADVADQQRHLRRAQLREAEAAAEAASFQHDAALVELNSQSQRLGLPIGVVKAALDDARKSVWLSDLGVTADQDTTRSWDREVTVYYREALNLDLAEARRKRILDDLRGGLASLVGGAHTPDGKVVGSITETQFQSATATASGLRGFGYSWLFAIPSEVLTLVLALVLGALGSALHMTKVVLEGGGETPSHTWLLFRPCQGVLMALVVFVLLKAGQLTMAAGDADALNPFFVAFVGVVSGLLATDAYSMIQRAGASIIPPGTSEGARWAFGLAAALEQSGLDAATIAQGVGVTEDDLKSWIAEAKPVPWREQSLIAAWLRAPARSLFTADPPPGMPKAALAQSAAQEQNAAISAG